jgi:hypothetical protein
MLQQLRYAACFALGPGLSRVCVNLDGDGHCFSVYNEASLAIDVLPWRPFTYHEIARGANTRQQLSVLLLASAAVGACMARSWGLRKAPQGLCM